VLGADETVRAWWRWPPRRYRNEARDHADPATSAGGAQAARLRRDITPYSPPLQRPPGDDFEAGSMSASHPAEVMGTKSYHDKTAN
jgi:hypothetical protein